ncbi:MAG: tRNA1(Val) (adenine(37)-N6)-methyltransferase [Desulfobulbaceae bacterium]|uniref:tRNA1(Val) (Adenine(37)-N6)-methyltransferase n=1 Tax=Candidatus Desulfobia pelagia TaxID=2841692 RepID=A0A8J6TGD6_9BACT|nr:tRNA1(Val) (adenine(37)-N6)-methyltransferase [Candidatus Desulfobia pelagia]
MNHPRTTKDTLFDGDLHCCQYEKGYRFSLDPVLLAHFVQPRVGQRFLDLGAGSGIISLILSYRWPSIRLTALELQPQLFSLIEQNVRQNSFQERIGLMCGDLRRIDTLLDPESFDQVVCNPPYGSPGSGRLNPGDEQAIARHEIQCELSDIVQAISFCLKNRGRASLVYPADRAAVLIQALKNKRLEPKRLQVVHSYPGSSGKLVLIEVMKNGGEELEILPPFYVYTKQGGEYSPEMAQLYKRNR